jgi:hypothetical protein
MLLFRSEEHVDAWCEQRGRDRGAVFTPQQMWLVADDWFNRRLAPDWRRHTLQETQELFARAGLVGEFWRLSPPQTS